ncbi:hypothetical protein [Sporosarcina sp. P7]|uniref:hypothetical protein n=1 Tax=Sporosarcina sp. P7 TaxID=2048244 RepID=UPI000C165A75|nr:hypothetical protein [Sporosarcina sp. P7]PID24099.1 hypothetical protein CSV60_11860 [Sporosarcina sp. P7]
MIIKHFPLKNIGTLIMLLIFGLLLSACGESTIKAESKNILSYPEGVQNGSVTDKYYEELQFYYKLDTQHQKIIVDLIEGLDKNPKLLYSNEKVDEMTKAISDYNNFLIEFNPISTTEAENEFSALLTDITKSQLSINSSLEKYLKSKNILHFIPLTLLSSGDEAKKEELMELSKKHKIYTE